MKERFSQMINDLGDMIELNLTLDVNDSCQIIIEETLAIQIEENDQDEVVIGSFLGELMAGRFREDALTSALIANYLSHEGVFAYNEPNNQLTYFMKLPLQGLTVDTLKETLALFSEVALDWHAALADGKTSPDAGPSNSQPPSSNPFLTP